MNKLKSERFRFNNKPYISPHQTLNNMAGNTDYFPKKDTALKGWCETYRETLPQYAALFGLTPAEVAEQQQWCDEIAQKVQEVFNAKATMKSVTASKELVKNKNILKLRKSIKRMKASANFSSGIGTHLKVNGGINYTPGEDYKPKFKLTLYGNHVRIKYVKRGIDGVEIFRKIEGHEDWKSIGIDYHSPFIDAQPEKTPGVPEIRKYKLIAIVDDKRFGQFSDVADLPVVTVRV